MTIISYDPVPLPEVFLTETGLKPVSLVQLLQLSDFVSLHCDLNPTSYHLLDHAQFNLMRANAYIINTSRGSVICEAALIAALRIGKIAGAALDVFETEPLPGDSPLRQMRNCLLAPHNSNSGVTAKRRVHESTISNLLSGLNETN
jgi:D-3-phosphoglycerate dehydrogenase